MVKIAVKIAGILMVMAAGVQFNDSQYLAGASNLCIGILLLALQSLTIGEKKLF